MTSSGDVNSCENELELLVGKLEQAEKKKELLIVEVVGG